MSGELTVTYSPQTLHILTEEDSDSLAVGVSPFLYVDHLVPSLYTLTQVSAPNCAKALMQVCKSVPEPY